MIEIPTEVDVKIPPPIICFLGAQKIGKTSFACKFPSPIIIQTERGAAALPVPKIPPDPADQWPILLECIMSLLKQPHDRKTVILDTIDIAETLCMEYVCKKSFGDDWDKFAAYGRGAVATAGEFRRLINGLTMLRDKKNMNVIVLSHEGLQRGANVLGDDYMKFGGKLSKQGWALVRDWADQVGHMCMKMQVVGGDKDRPGKPRQLGDERVIVFKGSPGRDAGCRVGYEMPDEIKLSFDEYLKHMKEKINE